MAGKYKSPGVYIEEINAFPQSVAEVATAIPAFIGYTEKAIRDGQSLLNTPVKITSILDYIAFFGEDFNAKFDILEPELNETRPIVTINGTDKIIDYVTNNKAFMFKSLKFFYANGGNECYILSVGTYENQSSVDIDVDALLGISSGSQPFEGLNALKNEQEPTMVVIPDAVNLSASYCYSLYQKVLEHCAEMQNRIAIFDIHSGFKARSIVGSQDDIITNFRENIGTEHLSYGVAYYPWLNTNIQQNRDLTFEHINLELSALSNLLPETTTTTLINNYIDSSNTSQDNKRLLHLELLKASPTYGTIINGIHEVLNLLPPSAAMAGIYSRVDAQRGVWNAPANISVAAVVSPSVQISNSDQENLNVDSISGKSINAIRIFPGRGILVWGARTLDGNSGEWRYINVKRTIITIKESIKLAISSFVFEPNTTTTWVSVKNRIESYLNALWRDGAFVGSSPREAFGVQIGLGSTMTSSDILEGKMKITVFVAMIKPAEFIVMNFVQQMQES